MMGPTHRCFGALCGAAVASAAGQPWYMVAMTSVVATSTAHGWSSPDMDQTDPWETVRQVLPSPLDRVMNHRGITHWWGTAVLAWYGMAQLPVDAQWPAFALLIGWVSHLIGDAIFGTIPLLPWEPGPCVGLGLDTDGFLESGKIRLWGKTRKVLPVSPTRLLIVAALAWVLFAGTPDAPDVLAMLGVRTA